MLTKPRLRTMVVSFCGLAIASSFGACAFEPDEESEDEEVGVSQDAFTGWVGLGVVATNGNLTVVDETVSPGTLAALSGVKANLGDILGTGNPYVQASVRLNTPFLFQLYADPAPGETLAAEGWAMYPPTAYGVASCSHSGAGSQQVSLGSPGGTFRCFLRKISNTNGDSWGSWGDQALISYPGGVPKLTCYNDSEAEAQCMSVTSHLGSVAAGSSSSATSTNLGATDWTNGKVCVLYGINGTFRTDSTSDKVLAHYSGSTWYFDTSAGKGGYVDCVY